jgi:hypothetical protein
MATTDEKRLSSAETALADHAMTLRDLATEMLINRDTRAVVADLLRRLDRIDPPDNPRSPQYRPEPSPQIWQGANGRWVMPAEERRELATRLRDWVDRVYRPAFGHLARALPDCWEQHPYCLMLLDVLRERHSCLYAQSARDAQIAAQQAEFHIRAVPELSVLLGAERKNCKAVHGTAVAA